MKKKLSNKEEKKLFRSKIKQARREKDMLNGKSSNGTILAFVLVIGLIAACASIVAVIYAGVLQHFATQ